MYVGLYGHVFACEVGKVRGKSADKRENWLANNGKCMVREKPRVNTIDVLLFFRM